MTHPKENKRAAKGLYFQHDSDAHNDDRIIAMMSVYGNAGYGSYWIVLEHMRKLPGFKLKVGGKHGLTSVARMLHENVTNVEVWLNDCCEHFVDEQGKGLFVRDGEYIYSESFIRRMAAIEERRNKNSGAGKISAAKKAEKRTLSTQSQHKVNTRSTKVQQHVNLSKLKLKLNTNNNNINTNNAEIEIENKKPPKRPARKKKPDEFVCNDQIIRGSKFFTDPEFARAWESYIAARKEFGISMTERSAKSILNELVATTKMNIETAVRMVDRATAGGENQKPYLFVYPVTKSNANTESNKLPQGKVNDAYNNAANKIT